MVFTLMELSPSSKLGFFDESRTVIPLPVEGSKCGIAIDVPREFWSEISLKFGARSLEVLFDEKEDLAYSEWPLCGPGDYELYLVCRDYRERRKITLMPRYFTEGELSCMLEELKETLPRAIALQLIECGAQLGTLEPKPSPEDEFLQLRRAINGTDDRLGLLQILPVIERECNHVLIPRTELRDSNQLRRPDISKLPGIMSMPGNVLSPDIVFQMYDMTVERSFDTYENRLVKAYVQALRGRLSRLQDRMEQLPPAVVSEIETLTSEFNLACARATFLRQVKLPTVFTGRVTMVLLKNPAYRIVFEDYLALNQQSSVTLEEAALSDPLNQFPFLYELWANLRILSAMLQVGVESGFRCVSHNWVKRFNKGLFIQMTNDEKPAIELTCPATGRRATLMSWIPDHGNEVLDDTPNHERLIALAILIDSPKEKSQLLVFDPEYRVAARGAVSTVSKEDIEVARSSIEPMKEDIDDLIHWVGVSKTTDSDRTIPYAAALYPGPRKQFSPEVEALTAIPSDGDGLQQTIYDVLRRYLA
ncbi:MAG: restriction endonuclease-like protein [Candidatus Obscuribacterales bacterium]|nr:restriction endonuclease-like protein [Candidatus Obscuribacterales bacterium]